MDDKKEIMIFFDLEGTIIEEELGEMNKEKIRGVLDSISRLEENTGCKVNIHIVSPVFIEQMEKILDKLDRTIIRYNIANGKRLKEVQGAVAHPDVKFINEGDFLHDRIVPMKLPKTVPDGYKDKYGKFDYVRNWIETMGDKIEFSIYGGNGFNDTKAMEYIKRNKKGFVICPENSHQDVKKIADYVSEGHAADGIADGINFINEQIEQRKGKVDSTIDSSKTTQEYKNTREIMQGDTQGDETENR